MVRKVAAGLEKVNNDKIMSFTKNSSTCQVTQHEFGF